MGLAVELLMGDRSATVAPMAATAGIDEVRADADPGGKIARLAALQAQGRRVFAVGDGLNDAPVPAAAWVSMSPATGADLSQTAADLVFQGDRLAPVSLALAVAGRSGRPVTQNLVFALAYNAPGVRLAMAGLVTPIVAAAAMSSSWLLVVLNAFRAAPGRRP